MKTEGMELTDDIITAEPLVGGDMAAELIDNLRAALSVLPWESVTITIITDDKTKIKMSKTREIKSWTETE